MKNIKIEDKIIGENRPTFIIAEAGINHGGKVDVARELIIAASKCGADAVKFQTYKTEKRVSHDSPIFDLLKNCELSRADHQELIKVAKEHNIIFFSTPFDEESIMLLIDLGVPAIKIASFDIVNFKLLKNAAGVGVPLIASTGMANKEEVDKAVELFEKNSVEYCLLHCISAYPANEEDANLNVIKTIKGKYNCPIGYSDHTLGIKVPVLAVAVGATIIEKHFTLDKNLEGPDHKMSADPSDLTEMIVRVRNIEKILGSNEIKLFEAEKGTMPYRRITKV